MSVTLDSRGTRFFFLVWLLTLLTPAALPLPLRAETIQLGDSHLWSKRFGSTYEDEGLGVAVDGSGNVVVTGYFNGTVDFGGGGLTSAGNDDIFVVKLGAFARRRGQLISD